MSSPGIQADERKMFHEEQRRQMFRAVAWSWALDAEPRSGRSSVGAQSVTCRTALFVTIAGKVRRA
jgi:hypothetical protein